MLESVVGQWSSLAPTTIRNVNYPSVRFPRDRFFAEDSASTDICISAPVEIAALSRNGIGVAPKMNVLKKCSVAKAAIMVQ